MMHRLIMPLTVPMPAMGPTIGKGIMLIATNEGDPQSLTDEAIAVRHKIYNNPELNAAQQKFMATYLGGPEPRVHEITDALLAKIARPTLVYWADHNPMPPFVGQRMASLIPGAQFHCAAHTGHWAQFENADEHNAVVLRFLTGDAQLGARAPAVAAHT